MCTSWCLSSWAGFMSVSLVWYWCALQSAFLFEPTLCRFPSCGTDVHFMVPFSWTGFMSVSLMWYWCALHGAFFLNWFYVAFPHVVLMCTSWCLFLELVLCQFPSCGTDVHFMVPFSWTGFMSVSLMWYWCALQGALHLLSLIRPSCQVGTSVQK